MPHHNPGFDQLSWMTQVIAETARLTSQPSSHAVMIETKLRCRNVRHWHAELE